MKEVKQAFDVRVKEPVFNAVGAEHGRKPRDAGRRFGRFYNRRMDEEYQDSSLYQRRSLTFKPIP